MGPPRAGSTGRLVVAVNVITAKDLRRPLARNRERLSSAVLPSTHPFPPRFSLRLYLLASLSRRARANCSNAVIAKSSVSIKRDSRRSLSPKFQMDYEIRASRMLLIIKPSLVCNLVCWENCRISYHDIFININKLMLICILTLHKYPLNCGTYRNLTVHKYVTKMYG